jgi:16S rRNA (uracil1498-N3)-methyltransferase
MPQLDFRRPRLFVDAALAAGETVALERSQSNYLGNVLRLSEGDTILVFNGCDGEWQASIGGRKRPDSLRIVAQTRPQDRLPDLAYVFAPLKHARLDYMVQKAVEMGAVRHPEPCNGERADGARPLFERPRWSAPACFLR